MKTSARWHACARLASIIGAGLALAVVVFLVKAGSSPHVSIVHAAGILPACGGSAVPCMLGPNLEVVTIAGSIFSGTGPCVGGTTLFSASPTSPGFSATGIPTPCAAFSSTQSETISVAALNGYEIEGISSSATCGVTGSNSLRLSANSITLTCPEESGVGATTTVDGQVAFSPVTSLTETITFSNTSTPGGSSSLSAISDDFLLGLPIWAGTWVGTATGLPPLSGPLTVPAAFVLTATGGEVQWGPFPNGFVASESTFGFNFSGNTLLMYGDCDLYTLTVSPTSISGTLSTTCGNVAGIPQMQFNLTLQSRPLQIEPPGVLSTGSGLAYSHTLTATGGTGGYTWSVSTGSLPAGFTLITAPDGSGLISSTGIPTAFASTYPFTVQVKDSAGNIAQQLLALQITCPVSITYTPVGQSVEGLPTGLQAKFIPPNGQTVTGYASACGFSNFDWQQEITLWPSPNDVPDQELFAHDNLTKPLFAPPGVIPDPPLGGYSYQYSDPLFAMNTKNFATAFPFYYSPLDFSNGCARWQEPSGTCITRIENGGAIGGTALNFFDSPRSPQCESQSHCIALRTRLVGVCDSTSTSPLCSGSGASVPLPLTQWSWMSNVSCISGSSGNCTFLDGGVSTMGGYLAPGGTESGGVTITSINGVPSPPLSVDPSANTIPALGSLSVDVNVGQSQGEPVPAGTVTLTGGTYTSGTATLDGNSDANITIPAGSLPVGSDMLTAVYTPTTPLSATYSQAWGTAMVTVTPVNQSISFAPITAQLIGASIPLNATATSGLTVSFQTQTPTVCSVSQATANMLSAGTCTIRATQSGNIDYDPANSVEVSFSVSYGVCLLYDPTKAAQSGSTIPLKIQLCNSNGADASNSSIVVNAANLVQISTNAAQAVQASGNANPDNNFRFDSTLGPTGGYIFNLSTNGLTTGTYQLTFTAGADPISHALSFQVR